MSIATITLEQLRTIDLFEGESDAELERWLAVTMPFDAAAGDIVVGTEQSPRGLFLLFEGSLEVLLTADGRYEPAGRQVAPTWLGGIPALTGGTLGVTIRAETSCRFGLIERETFITLVLANRAVHGRIMRQIGPVMSRLTSTESNRERLASLGTMAAGLAHELNNPAAAAKRAASSLVEALDVVNSALAAFVEGGIERHEAEQLLVLQREAMARMNECAGLDAVAASDAEDTMLELLEDLDVPEPWRLAEPLSCLDADWLARVHAVAGDVTPGALSWVAASLTAHGLAEELLESADRMSTLVGAVKSYAYMDRGGVVSVDVHEGLESTLVILGHKLKQTQINVVRHYDKTLPHLIVRGSELNQVWTNLLDNAIGALGESGTITITTRRDGPCLLVDIGDDGPGIPEEARARVLDPFFSTKPVGQGTGLGLDTARRIVEERHRGTLGFDSGDGGTVFHVWLPFEETAR
jgi:signal transduction histidine kinase